MSWFRVALKLSAYVYYLLSLGSLQTTAANQSVPEIMAVMRESNTMFIGPSNDEVQQDEGHEPSTTELHDVRKTSVRLCIPHMQKCAMGMCHGVSTGTPLPHNYFVGRISMPLPACMCLKIASPATTCH